MKEKELQRAKAALLTELDVTLQKYCHQRLNDVVNDLRIRYVNVKPDSPPDEMISAFLQSGVLKRISVAPMVRLRESMERIRQGTFGMCTSCGRKISTSMLEQNPTATLCAYCSTESQKLMHPKGK